MLRPYRPWTIRLVAMSIVASGTFVLWHQATTLQDPLLGEADEDGYGGSMQHGWRHQDGILDAFDTAEYVRESGRQDVTPMVDARARGGPFVAGDHGDVIVFSPGAGADHRFQHRAIVWVEYNATSGLFDVPALGLGAVTSVRIGEVGRWEPVSDTYVRREAEVLLVRQGPSGRDYPAGAHSGWLTKGDRPGALDQDATYGPPTSPMVRPEWVLGKVSRVLDHDPFLAMVLNGPAGTWMGAAVALVAGMATWFGMRRREGDAEGPQ